MAGKKRSGPPKAFLNFKARFPKLAQAWDLLGEGGSEGPLDERASRLVKLGISIATRAEGATHSAVRKAKASGATTPASSAEIVSCCLAAASSRGSSGSGLRRSAVVSDTARFRPTKTPWPGYAFARIASCAVSS